MNSIIHISFSYTERDVVEAARADYASRYRFGRLIAVMVGETIFGFGCWFFLSRWAGMVLVGLTASMGLLISVCLVVTSARIFRREHRFRDEHSFRVSPEGMHLRAPDIDSQIQWGLFSQAVIDAHCYLLYHSSRMFTLIPKRVFQPAQAEAFDQLLTLKISRIIRNDTGKLPIHPQTGRRSSPAVP